MEDLESYANRLKSQYPDLTEDINQILGDVRIDLKNGRDENVATQQAFRMIDELL